MSSWRMSWAFCSVRACACAIGLASALALMLASGCDDGRIPSSCGAIPDPNGCPNDSSDVCNDLTCSGVYACRSSGQWELVRTCPAHPDAGTDASHDADASDDASQSDAGCGEAPDSGDLNSGAGCPSLQAPDCDVSVALSCPAQACITGCESFLVCIDGAWAPNYAAYCDEDGQLVWNPN
ncbi:MAG: hypothetical protein U0165_00065 [Polyangiaceae bacterium]